MQITSNNYSIAEIINMLDRRELLVNSSYQRGTELWPAGPRSYFIDTILSKYPFPKIYFFEEYDISSGRNKREVVDGQQRLATISAFLKGDFALSSEHAHGGQRFADLDDDSKRAFLQYVVAVDVIRDASQAEIVEMFRRMNAYTLPLNDAEKRHAAFQGPFKWTMLNLAGELGEFFSQFGVFTNRQMVRMADQELLSELYMFKVEGLFSSSPTLTRRFYKDGDTTFADADDFRNRTMEAVQFITERLPRLRRTFMMKPYALYTLLCGLLFNRYGEAPAGFEYQAEGSFARNPSAAQDRLLALAEAHEAKETDGPYQEYVAGCLGGTNRSTQRKKRFDAVLAALKV